MTNTLTAEQALEALFLDSCHFHDGNLREDEYQTIRKALTSPPSPPVPGEAWAMSEDQYDGVRDLIKRAYEQGANDVHQNYQEDVDPDFSEAAMDYGESVTQEFIDLFPSVRPSPLTNEPVGVTISAKDVREVMDLLHLSIGRHFNDNRIDVVREVRKYESLKSRLSAAIGERR